MKRTGLPILIIILQPSQGIVNQNDAIVKSDAWILNELIMKKCLIVIVLLIGVLSCTEQIGLMIMK